MLYWPRKCYYSLSLRARRKARLNKEVSLMTKKVCWFCLICLLLFRAFHTFPLLALAEEGNVTYSAPVKVVSHRVTFQMESFPEAAPKRAGAGAAAGEAEYITLEAQMVLNGEAAIAPDLGDGRYLLPGGGALMETLPAGTTFAGWDQDFSSVTGDLVVTAKFDNGMMLIALGTE